MFFVIFGLLGIFWVLCEIHTEIEKANKGLHQLLLIQNRKSEK